MCIFTRTKIQKAMDNLWVYLILIFGYVGYSLVKSARKQREGDGEESEEERFFSEEQDLRRNLNDVLKSRPGTIPASVYDRGAATGVSREKGLKKVPGGFSRRQIGKRLGRCTGGVTDESNRYYFGRRQ